MRKPILLLLLLLGAFASNGTILLSEGFESTSWPAIIPPWTVTNAAGNTNYYNGVLGWVRTGNGGVTGSNPSPNVHTGVGMACFDAYWISSGGVSTMTSPSITFPATGSNYVTFWLYAPVKSTYYSDKLEVLVGTTVVKTIILNTDPTLTSNAWNFINIPVTISGSQTVSWRGTSNYGNDFFVDDVSIANLSPCSGTISAGRAFATPNPVCAGISFTINDTAFTSSGNMNYIWQSAPAGTTTWTTITAATPTAFSAAYTVTGGISTATDYRFIATCTLPGGGTDTSNVVHVTLNNYLSCYCIPNHLYGACTTGEDLNSVKLAGIFGTSLADTNNPCPNGTATTNPGYKDYSSTFPCVLVYAPSTYTISLNSNYQYMEASVMFDWNNSGAFGDSTGEVVNYSSYLATAPNYTNITFTVPSTARPGQHRMRVRVGSFQVPGPCNDVSYGETRDYCITVLKQTPPVPTVVTNSPLCPFTTLTMTACTDPLYPSPVFTFYGPDPRLPIAIPGNSSNCATFNLSNIQPNLTNYTVTVTASGYTSAPAAPAITVYKVPLLNDSAVKATTTCTGSDGSMVLYGFDSVVNYTLYYRYNGVAATPKNITSTGVKNYLWAGLQPGIYDSIRVTTPQGCRSNIITVPVVIGTPTPPATPTANYQSPICAGDTLKFSVTNQLSGGQYLWIGPTGFRSTVANATRPLVNFPDTGNYYVTVQNATTKCLAGPGIVNVKLAAPGIAPTPVNVTYCQFDVAQPLIASGVGLLYYDSLNQPLKTGVVSRIPSTAVAGTFTYYVTQTTTCESQRTPITVLIKPQPAYPAISSPNIEYCQYETVGPLSVSGTAVRWYTTPTGGTGSATAPTPVTLVPGTFFFYATQSINGCESQRLVIRVIIKPKPQPPAVVSPLNLCQFDPIQPLTAVGQNLLWYTAAAGGVGVPVAPLPNTGYEDSFKYWVTQTVNGCMSDRALIAVNVNYKPNGILTGAASSVCQDATDTFFYYGNARADAQYIWFSPLSTHVLSGAGTQGPYVVQFDTFGTAVVRLTINNKGCISQLLSAPIQVRPLPVISFVKRQDVCQDELLVVSLNAVSNNPEISGFNWDFDASDANIVYGVNTTGGPFGVRYPTPGHYQIGATASAGGCTSDPIYQDVYVHALPDATISADQSLTDAICSSDTIRLAVKQVEEGASYIWTPGAFFQNANDSLNNIVDAVVSQSAEVKVRVKTAFGCVATDSIKVTTKPCCGVYFPNAFAPNGNVIQNRTFKPITSGIHRVNTFKVMNRWGQVVYESKMERNGWDGSTNGQPQDMGTYFYFMSYQCEGKTVEEHGEFLLIR